MWIHRDYILFYNIYVFCCLFGVCGMFCWFCIRVALFFWGLLYPRHPVPPEVLNWGCSVPSQKVFGCLGIGLIVEVFSQSGSLGLVFFQSPGRFSSDFITGVPKAFRKYGYGSKRCQPLGTTGFSLCFLLPIGFFRSPVFLTHMTFFFKGL